MPLPSSRATGAERHLSTSLNRRSLLLGASGVLALTGLPAGMRDARAWTPTKPVHVFIGFPAGGAVDIVVRIVADGVRRTSGATVVGEIRSGAYGTIAMRAAAQAAPDGYTLSSAIMGNMSVLPATPGAKVAVDVENELTPVINLAGTAMALVARPDAPFNDVDGFIAYAKSKPGEATYASSGPGSINHFAAAYIATEIGVKMIHVPYRGGAPATADLMGGRVDIMVANIAEVAPMVADGRLKALGVSARESSPMMPKATPLAQRFPALEFNNWFGLAGPAKMPPEVVQRVAGLFAAALRDAQTVEALAKRGLDPLGIIGPAFGEQARRDRERWAKVAKAASIRID